MACKEDNYLMLLNFKFKTFSINLNAQHVNGMTPFDLAFTVIRYPRSSQSANSFMPRSNKSGVTILNSTSLILIGGTPFSIAPLYKVAMLAMVAK